MGFYICKKNTGIFHNKYCKCTDNEAEANRIGLFFSTDDCKLYKYELQSIITKYQDFANVNDENERKKYNDALEQYEIIKNYC